MKPIRVTVSGIGESVPIPLDIYANPQNASLVVIVTGTVTYTVEHTFDDVYDVNFNPVTADWIAHPVLQDLTATQDGNYAFPPSACRLSITAGTGSAEFVVTQASGGNS